METNTENTTVSTKEDFNLAAELAQATEQKKPAPAQSETKKSTSFWGDESDFEAPKKEDKINPAQPIDNANKASEQLTDKAIRQSASVAVGMIDFTQQSLFLTIVKKKFDGKFNKEEKEKILDIEDKTGSFTEEEEALKKKWDRLCKKKEKLAASIPFTNDEEKKLEEAFFKYFQYKQIELPPSAHMWFAVANTLGQRAIDIVFD